MVYKCKLELVPYQHKMDLIQIKRAPVHKITNLPFVYMGLDVWIWMGGNQFLGAFEGVGPEIFPFLGTTLVAISEHKNVSISGPIPSKAPRYGLLPHPNPYVPPHINNWYINS
jgi:hypothetical protein